VPEPAADIGGGDRIKSASQGRIERLAGMSLHRGKEVLSFYQPGSIGEKSGEYGDK